MRIFALLTLAVVLASDAQAQNSPFGGFGGAGQADAMRAMMNNPNMIFDQVARGKEYITRGDLEALPPFMSGRALQMFDRTLQELGITNGQLTRDQFKSAFEQGVQRMRNRGMGGPGGASTESVDRLVEERFRGLDKNSDGLLQLDEMPDALKTEREKWDANKDGFIDITEYKAYTQARFGDRANERRGEGNPADGAATEASMISFGPAEQLPAERPVVFRAGKLPKDLPAWFAQLDTDQDGQVGLYEWVRGGRSLTEYQSTDFNDDGFLTAEEVLRVAKNKSAPGANGALASNPVTETPNSPRTPEATGNDQRRGPGGWGGFGGGRRAPGGGGWQGGRGR